MHVLPVPVPPRRRHPAAIRLVVGIILQLHPNPQMPEVCIRDPLNLGHWHHRPTRYHPGFEVHGYGVLGDSNGQERSRALR